MNYKSELLVLFKYLFLAISIMGGQSLAEQRPEWIDNPQSGVVGSAPYNIKGRFAQEELAISRARTRLAARLGVEVNSIQQINEVVINDQSTVQAKSETTQKITKKVVKAYAKAKWHDEYRDIIYVWVLPVE
jgi:hypothetical protein